MYTREDVDLDKVRKLMISLLIMIFGLIVLTILITNSLMTMIILNYIIKPLEKLRLGTEKIKAGDLEYITKYTRDDEFGSIFTDFESMRRELLYSKMEKDKYDRNRNELIARITHDLNTPITSIKGFTSGLLDGIIKSPDRQRFYLESINHTVDQMSAMINELFLYSTLV